MQNPTAPSATDRLLMRRRHQNAVAEFFFQTNLNPTEYEARDQAIRRFELHIAQTNQATGGAVTQSLYTMPDVAMEYFRNKPWIALAFLRSGFDPSRFSTARQHACYGSVSFADPECLEIIQRGIALGWQPDLVSAHLFSHPATTCLVHWIKNDLPMEAGFALFEALFDASPSYSFDDASYCVTASRFSPEQRRRGEAIISFASSQFEARELRQTVDDPSPGRVKARSTQLAGWL